MHDAKPVLILLVLSGCGLFWLSLQWLGASKSLRQDRLRTIAVIEEALLLPPTLFKEQVRWLLTHRRDRLRGLTGLMGLSAVIGLAQGLASRRPDPLAGMGLWTWTLGVMSSAFAPGLAGALLLWPRPWSLGVVGSMAALWSGVTVWALSRGRPYVQ